MGSLQRSFELDLAYKPKVQHFYDAQSSTFSYVVQDPGGSSCAIIDSVLDIDYAAGKLDYSGADAIVAFVKANKLKVEWIIETHVHADHLSAAPYLKHHLGGKMAIGRHIDVVQKVFGKVFNEGEDFPRDGSQFDHLFEDMETYSIGGLTGVALHTPGHTPACMTHIIGDSVFVGDTIFMPDAGSARADFPGGDARRLYQSIQRLLSLPGELNLYMCHDYAPNNRELRFQTTVAEERKLNIHVHEGISEDEYVAMREARDKTLGMPKLIIPSIQVNMKAGHLPEVDDNGVAYLKVPLNLL